MLLAAEPGLLGRGRRSGGRVLGIHARFLPALGHSSCALCLHPASARRSHLIFIGGGELRQLNFRSQHLQLGSAEGVARGACHTQCLRCVPGSVSLGRSNQRQRFPVLAQFGYRAWRAGGGAGRRSPAVGKHPEPRPSRDALGVPEGACALLGAALCREAWLKEAVIPGHSHSHGHVVQGPAAW